MVAVLSSVPRNTSSCKLTEDEPDWARTNAKNGMAAEQKQTFSKEQTSPRTEAYAPFRNR